MRIYLYKSFPNHKKVPTIRISPGAIFYPVSFLTEILSEELFYFSINHTFPHHGILCCVEII